MNKIGSFRYDYICYMCGKKFILITDGRDPNSRVWFTTKPNLVYNNLVYNKTNLSHNLECQCGGNLKFDHMCFGDIVLCA